jgi:hypothetical protein
LQNLAAGNKNPLMKNLVKASGREFYDEHIALFQAAKTDELIRGHYHDDAVLVTFGKVIRGSAQLKSFFREYRASLGNFEVLSLDQFVETEGALLFEATVRTAVGNARVYDAFALREGKITHHFAGTITPTPK